MPQAHILSWGLVGFKWLIWKSNLIIFNSVELVESVPLRWAPNEAVSHLANNVFFPNSSKIGFRRTVGDFEAMKQTDTFAAATFFSPTKHFYEKKFYRREKINCDLNWNLVRGAVAEKSKIDSKTLI